MRRSSRPLFILVTALLLTMMALGGTVLAQSAGSDNDMHAQLLAPQVVAVGDHLSVALELSNPAAGARPSTAEVVKVTVNGVEVDALTFAPPDLTGSNSSWTGTGTIPIGPEYLPGPITLAATVTGWIGSGEFAQQYTINLSRQVQLVGFNFIKRVNGVKEAEIDLGDQVQYTFEVTNTGSARIENFIIEDPDTGFYYERGEPMVPGGGATITAPPYTPRESDFAGGVFVNTATVTVHYGPDEFNIPQEVTASDSATVTLRPEGDPEVDLAVRKSVDNATPWEGQEVVFTVTVTNNGPSLARDVVVEDVLPAGLTYASHTASRGAYDPATGEWTVGTLGVDGSATLTIRATVDAGTAGTTLTNTARLTDSDPVDNNPANNQSSASVTPQVPEEEPEEPEQPEQEPEEPVSELDEQPLAEPLPRTGGSSAVYFLSGLLALGGGLFLRRRFG